MQQSAMNQITMPIQTQLAAWLMRRTGPTAVRRVVTLAAAIGTEIGNVRKENQDRAVIARGRDQFGREFAVAVVADGIGGMREGAACAALAIATFISTLNHQSQTGSKESLDWLRIGATAANEAVFTKFRGDGGSTLVAVLIRPERPTCWLSIGDSRVYLSKGKELRQISIDDTIAGQLGKSSNIEFEQSKILQFIGMGADLEPHIATLDDDPFDSIVLTSDGVHFLAHTSSWLGHIVGNASDPGICVKRLVDLAKWCGGPDNATVAMITKMADQDSDRAPEYKCLEVWDAFGEIQIVVNETIRETEELGLRKRDASTIQKQLSKVSLMVEERLNRNDQMQSVIRKTPRGKPSRKVKTSAQQVKINKTDTSDSDVPQLQMDFPIKANK